MRRFLKEANIRIDDKAEIFHGEVIHTRDAIIFQGKTVFEIPCSRID